MDSLEVAKIKDKFEFHVESVGMYSPQDLVVEAIKKLEEKAQYWLGVLEEEGGEENIKTAQ